MINNFCKEIDTIHKESKEYSICTLVTNVNEYETMLKSFYTAGFNENVAEYLYIDNRNGKHDAYQGINKLIHLSQGKYIIVCHQDVELIYDNKSDLDKCLEELNKLDSNWALAGNAGGGTKIRNLIIRISDKHGSNTKRGIFPTKVLSLDENFLIIKKEKNIALSNDLAGFHFYGTDICLLADIRGLSAYVIDFHLLHKGKGICDKSFFEIKRDIITKYNKKFKCKTIQTTCAFLYLCPITIISNFMNNFGLKLVNKFLKKIEK